MFFKSIHLISALAGIFDPFIFSAINDKTGLLSAIFKFFIYVLFFILHFIYHCLLLC